MAEVLIGVPTVAVAAGYWLFKQRQARRMERRRAVRKRLQGLVA